MKLEQFQVLNFRSVADSGPVKVADKTALLGRNESGKTNLLLGLQSLNPPSGRKPLNPIKDFPRDRKLDECTDNTVVVKTTWRLTTEERDHLKSTSTATEATETVQVLQRYSGSPYVKLESLSADPFDASDAEAVAKRVKPLVISAGNRSEKNLRNAADAFLAASRTKGEKQAIAEAVNQAVTDLRVAFADEEVEVPDEVETELDALEAKAAASLARPQELKAAKEWVIDQLPVFVFLEEYPELAGHQDLKAFLERREQPHPDYKDRDENFERLCKVSGLNPEQLQELNARGEHEERNQLTNRAGAVVSKEIRRLWKDRKLKVRFHPDNVHLDIFVSDLAADYDVEVNLDERSRGFRWFFSFYVTFAADTANVPPDKVILLLDEPGLYLHARSQTDLLTHLHEDFDCQVMFTTHSPFMVPRDLDSIRTVSISAERGTAISNSPTGDRRTLFPLQAALGYELAHSMFVGQKNLVVEGVTDYWILQTVSDHVRDAGGKGLDPELTITPAGGAPRVPYMVALLSAQKLDVVVLLDHEPQGNDARTELLKSKLAREDTILSLSQVFDEDRQEADVEDLLDPSVYHKLVLQSFEKELEGKTLSPNENIPRLAKRYELAFSDLGLTFNKTRPARLFINLMAQEPDDVLPAGSLDRMSRLFTQVNECLRRIESRDNQPFR